MEWITYKGKKILLNDLSNLSVEAFIEKMKKFETMILEKGDKHVLVLSDIRGAKFDKRNVDELKRIAKVTTLYVDKYAVVGISGVQKILFHAVQMFSRHKEGGALEACDSIEAAKDWLVA